MYGFFSDIYSLANLSDLRETNKGNQHLQDVREGVVRKEEERDADDEEDHAADEPPRPSFLGVWSRIYVC